jgi:hypothetical protein
VEQAHAVAEALEARRRDGDRARVAIDADEARARWPPAPRVAST